MKRLTVLFVMMALATAAPLAQEVERVQRTDEYWYAYASELPIGATVRARTADGQRYTGALTHVDREGITIERRTRVPEAPLRIRFRQMDQLQLKENGSSVAKAIGIGIAVGAGTFFGIAMLFAAVMD
jgi:hypothetical protein